jgi:acetyl-CoA/propionyl-CoA carboxylase biotin carboxyl carrier protein
VEEVLDLSSVASTKVAAPVADDGARVKREIDVEVNGKRFNVSMWVPESAGTGAAPSRSRRRAESGSRSSGSGDVTAPMQGTIVKISVAVGDTVEAGDPIVVLEAMKMENNVVAERAGTVTEIRVSEGDSVGGGDVVAVID